MQVNAKIISSLAKHISPCDDIRYYLNGVLVEVSAQDIRYVATDGHKLIVARETHEEPYIGTPYSLIIPRDVCLKVKPKGKHAMAYAMLEKLDTFSVLVYQGDKFAFTPIDGTFPDYRAVLPKQIEKDGKSAGFNPLYLRALQMFAQDMGDNEVPSLYANGNSAACVTFTDPRFFAVVMPMKIAEPFYPEWLRPQSLAIAA